MRSQSIPGLVFALCLAACGGRTGSDLGGMAGDGGAGAAGGTGGTSGSGGAGATTVFDASLDVTGLGCDEQSRATRLLVSEAVAEIQKDLTCTTNEDCTNVSVSASCSASCTTFVNLAGAKKVRAAIEQIEGAACIGFKEKGCFSPVPPCNPVLNPACLNGKCTPFR